MKNVCAYAVSSLYYYPDDEGSVLPVIADEKNEANRSAGLCPAVYAERVCSFELSNIRAVTLTLTAFYPA